MTDKKIVKRKIMEFEDEYIDIYEGEDVERIKLALYKSFLKRQIPSGKATVLVETTIDLLSSMVELKFNNKAMMIYSKAIGFIKKKLS